MANVEINNDGVKPSTVDTSSQTSTVSTTVETKNPTFTTKRVLLGSAVAIAAGAAGYYFLNNKDTAKTLDKKGETGPIAPSAVIAKETATPTAAKYGNITVDNVVPRAVNVDIAKGSFVNKSGVFIAFIAEPGGLLVGPDFGYTGQNNPYGNNPAGWESMYRSGGSINTFNPVTQAVLRHEGSAFQNVPEGGFGFFSAGQMTVELPHPDGNKIFKMPYQQGNNYLFVVRGLYPDGKQDTDRNSTAKLTEYKAGHTLVQMYQSRYETNTGFISEGQFLQMVATSHNTQSNCGAEGCSKTTVVAFDLNTGALEIAEHTMNRTANLQQAIKEAGQNWNRVYSNYR